MILIASTRDWCTKKIARDFKSKVDKVILISADRNFGDIRLAKLFIPIRVLFYFSKSTYYASVKVILENLLFDLAVSLLIIIIRPSSCILWTGMSKYSLIICKYLGIKTALWQGEEYLPLAASRKIHDVWPYWLRQAKSELFTTNIILVESTFVKTSLPEEMQFKCKIIFSLIDDNFLFNTRKNSLANTNKILKIGIISTYTKKNTEFALTVVKDLSQFMVIELHIFGDKSFFDNNKNESYSFPIKIHNFIPNIKTSYISELMEIDVFLFPTLSDGGPRALVEVASLGIKVISSYFSIGPDINIYFKNLTVLPLKKEDWIKNLNKEVESQTNYSYDIRHCGLNAFRIENERQLLEVALLLKK